MPKSWHVGNAASALFRPFEYDHFINGFGITTPKRGSYKITELTDTNIYSRRVITTFETTLLES